MRGEPARQPRSRDPHVGVLLPHEVDVAPGQVLAHDQAPVVALGVVPTDIATTVNQSVIFR